MISRKATCFALPVFDQWLVHAPLHEITALVNGPGFECLIGEGPDGEVPSDASALSIVALRQELRSEPIHRPTPKQGRFDPRFLAIVTTRGCNIDCVYCDFGGPTSARTHMDPALAVEAIDWMADHLIANGRNDFHLHFFGGEPFISGDLVDVIVHRTRLVCAERGLRPYIDVSTNGVISEARARWVGRYFDSVILSFDGPPELQDRTRPGRGGRPTFAHVDRTARILRDSNVELCLRVCVTGDSVRRMPELTRWMAEDYTPAVINFEPLTENDLTSGAGISGADPFEFARFWMAAKRIADERGIRLVYSATEDSTPRLSSCPVGSDAAVITPDGSINGCYLQPNDWLKHGMNMNLGTLAVRGGGAVDVNQVEHLRRMILDKPRCAGCVAQWSCAGGCHVSNTYKNCSDRYVDFCLQTRIITACLLLEELGERTLADALLSDDQALRRLATHTWDPFSVDSGAAPRRESVG